MRCLNFRQLAVFSEFDDVVFRKTDGRNKTQIIKIQTVIICVRRFFHDTA